MQYTELFMITLWGKFSHFLGAPAASPTGRVVLHRLAFTSMCADSTSPDLGAELARAKRIAQSALQRPPGRHFDREVEALMPPDWGWGDRTPSTSIVSFPSEERRMLLNERGIGPLVVARLEEVGLGSLDQLRRVGPARAAEILCARVGSPAWLNRQRALSRALEQAERRLQPTGRLSPLASGTVMDAAPTPLPLPLPEAVPRASRRETRSPVA